MHMNEPFSCDAMGNIGCIFFPFASAPVLMVHYVLCSSMLNQMGVFGFCWGLESGAFNLIDFMGIYGIFHVSEGHLPVPIASKRESCLYWPVLDIDFCTSANKDTVSSVSMHLPSPIQIFVYPKSKHFLKYVVESGPTKSHIFPPSVRWPSARTWLGRSYPNMAQVGRLWLQSPPARLERFIGRTDYFLCSWWILTDACGPRQ